MMVWRLAILCLISVPVWAGPVPPGLEAAPDQTAAVRSLSDGDTLVLTSGREVRLVGIQAPKLPLGRPNFEEWPLARQAKSILEQLVRGAELLPAYGGAKQDRHGRSLAHLFRVSDGLWLQKHMLLEGMARVYTFADNRALAADLLGFERIARAQGKGIWSHPYYAVRTASQLERNAGKAGQFLLVEGMVVKVANFRDRSYVNFGDDYKTDFSLMIEARDRERFGTGDEEDRNHDETGRAYLSGLTGQNIRVRGWLFYRNGPMIKLTHPEQIELLD